MITSFSRKTQGWGRALKDFQRYGTSIPRHLIAPLRSLVVHSRRELAELEAALDASEADPANKFQPRAKQPAKKRRPR